MLQRSRPYGTATPITATSRPLWRRSTAREKGFAPFRHPVRPLRRSPEIGGLKAGFPRPHNAVRREILPLWGELTFAPTRRSAEKRLVAISRLGPSCTFQVGGIAAIDPWSCECGANVVPDLTLRQSLAVAVLPPAGCLCSRDQRPVFHH